jgi:hypothetical protein
MKKDPQKDHWARGGRAQIELLFLAGILESGKPLEGRGRGRKAGLAVVKGGALGVGWCRESVSISPVLT